MSSSVSATPYAKNAQGKCCTEESAANTFQNIQLLSPDNLQYFGIDSGACLNSAHDFIGAIATSDKPARVLVLRLPYLVERLLHWAPDINWRAMEGAPDDVGEMTGREAARGYHQDWLDTFDDLTAEPEELIEVGDDRVLG